MGVFMVGFKFTSISMAALCLLAGGCDGGASAVPVQKAEAARSLETAPTGFSEDAPQSSQDARRAPVPKIDGKPMWSSNRRFTAEQNAQRAFERNGEAFGVRSVEAFARKARAFVENPPVGSKSLTRENGDRLIYDPTSNVFAVATRDGTPRTMFKPDDGPAYWEKVKAQEAAGGSRRRSGGADSGG
jgi:hypothetical protein